MISPLQNLIRLGKLPHNFIEPEKELANMTVTPGENRIDNLSKKELHQLLVQSCGE